MPEKTYPWIKYQAVTLPEGVTPAGDNPGFRYFKVASAEEEAMLGQTGDPWYDTPAEAIANPPSQPKAQAKPAAAPAAHDAGAHEARKTEEWPRESDKKKGR